MEMFRIYIGYIYGKQIILVFIYFINAIQKLRIVNKVTYLYLSIYLSIYLSMYIYIYIYIYTYLIYCLIAVVQWLSLLHNFIQLSLNSVSAHVQILVVACRRFTMLRISDKGPGWK